MDNRGGLKGREMDVMKVDNRQDQKHAAGGERRAGDERGGAGA